jgi:predicted house-cleaning noncanonical NTP pyrophosphatase (MazG superfamily)
MIRFYYGEDGKGKLVRDTLDKKICSEKHIVKARHLKKEDLAEAIVKKLPEEAKELSVALAVGDIDEEKAELADVLTLLDSYIKVRGFDKAEIVKIMNAKTAKKGAFDQGTFIEYVDLNPEGDDYEFWLKHFRDNADRYKETK